MKEKKLSLPLPTDWVRVTVKNNGEAEITRKWLRRCRYQLTGTCEKIKSVRISENYLEIVYLIANPYNFLSSLPTFSSDDPMSLPRAVPTKCRPSYWLNNNHKPKIIFKSSNPRK